MVRFKKKKDISPKYLLIVLSAICIGLIVLTSVNPSVMHTFKGFFGFFIVPVQEGADGVGEWISSRAKLMNDIEELEDENAKLKEQINAYQSEIERNEAELSELYELRELSGLGDLYPEYDMTVARVFSSNSSQWFNEFYINKGLNDGIYEECNVISSSGLVGIVTESYGNYAKVRAIIDDSSVVIGEIGSNGTICTISGSLTTSEDGLLYATDIDKNANIEIGDRVITSNVSDRFFYGLTIGYVKEITDDPNNITKSCAIVPAADFTDINDVEVILDRKQEVEY